MKSSFENSINVLVKAYLNDTLVQGNCYACAVGNLVKEAMGYSYVPCIDFPDRKIALKENEGRYCSIDVVGEGWYAALYNQSSFKFQTESKAIGYNAKEIRKIEYAFELRGDDYDEKNTDESIFRGLMAVVDVLAEIHGIDLTIREETKKMFIKPELCSH